jgi:hypothetical protein
MKGVSYLSILLMLMLPTVFAQTTDSNLTGRVYDASGAVVQNATIEIQNEATGVKYSTVSGNDGGYRFNNLPVGSYTITAKAAGFSTLSMKDVQLSLNKNVTANLKLEVGQVTETLVVSGTAAVLDTTTPQLQTTFESKQIVELPIVENGTGFYGALNLSLLSAGVSSNGGVGQGVGPAVGGQRPMNNNFTVEGVDNNNKTVTGPLVYVPTEATEEFSLLSNQYNAEFGHSTGGQFNTVVKGGTNSVHGSVYEYLQNRNLNAMDQSFARQGFQENQRFDSNKLGATIGGPIKKDKLFYFGSFEYSPTGQTYTLATPVRAPTAGGFALLDAMSDISQTNYGVFRQYVPPAPAADGITTVNGVDIPIGILPVSGPRVTNFYSAIASIDYTMSSKDQIRGRFIYNQQDDTDIAANLPVFWTNVPQRFYLVTVSDLHTFGPKLTNELRLGYNRFTQFYVVPDFEFPGLDKFPNLTMDYDLGIQIGPDSNAPQYTIQNTYQITENINWIVGSHTLKFGADLRDAISPQHFIQRERGDYNYSWLQDYLNDIVPVDDFAERNLGDTTYYGNQWATYLYATDTWNMRKNLTGYFGLRYERTTVPSSQALQSLNEISNVPGLIDFHSPTTYNRGFAPRIGLAYTPGKSGNTVVRAGFGMGYDVIFDNVGSTAYPPQLSSTFDAYTRPDLWHTPFLANGGIKPGDVPVGSNLTVEEARAATSSYIPDQVPPYSMQWNLGISHVFRNDYTFEIRYVGTRGVKLLRQDRMNIRNTPVTASRNLPTYLQRPSQEQLDALALTLDDLSAIDPNLPQWAEAGFTQPVVGFLPEGNSIYHGLALQATRRFSKGFSTVASYTWSHNIDDCTATHFSTYLSPRRAQDFNDLQAERSTSALDRRHRFTVNFSWDTPWFNSAPNWFVKNFAGNWRVVGTYTAESGELVTPQSGTDSNLNGDSVDRTVLNPSGNPLLGSDVEELTNTAGQTVGYLALNPDAMYIKAGAGAYPNAGRNTVLMPGINNFDLSFAKKFKVTEEKTIEFRADFANAFNHPQYTAGYVSSVRLTSQTNSRVFLYPSSAQFLQWDQNFPSNPRNIQLALRFTF